MVSSQQDGEYFSFEEYHSYKNKLDESHMFKYEEEEYQEFFQNAMPNDSEKHSEILNNCYILKKYLQNFISDESCSNGKCCSYMNYWLNKKMEKSKLSLTKPDFDVYNEYIQYYNNRNHTKICESNKFFISNDIYEEMKKIYSLYESYNAFIENKADSQSGCKNLNFCVTYYNKILRKCKQNRDTKFCKALQNFKNIFSTDNFVFISECENNFGEMKLKEPEELSEEDTEQVNFLYLSRSRGPGGTGLFEDSFFSQPRGSEEGDSDSIRSSFSYSSLIQTLFSSAFGMSILFLLSYKFTPFGKWIRSALLRKNIITHYETEEDTQDILSHTYENTNIDTENSVHNIQYYATQNS
ncbi:PIR Superfamily Protein [Plasmodium ovale wallikeri]|uniref:PIR Superfamily Protein n=1 Tax=Plasmodium ovale wallikeri TaxID=864142 RepID=A0A1A9AQP8_PLAOA|nr:PIR Superfamily Protein [Plasmodium ovale wallikeri]SBT58448.1 PIR Superfamily Protein [Plasmodium ovale wallikeri]